VEIKNFIAARFKDVVDQKLTTLQALDQIGIYGIKLVVEKIDSQIPPPNAPATIAKKGSSTPLIDTGQMRQTLLAQGWKSTIPKGN
jgi:hypothetical protein